MLFPPPTGPTSASVLPAGISSERSSSRGAALAPGKRKVRRTGRAIAPRSEPGRIASPPGTRASAGSERTSSMRWIAAAARWTARHHPAHADHGPHEHPDVGEVGAQVARRPSGPSQHPEPPVHERPRARRGPRGGGSPPWRNAAARGEPERLGDQRAVLGRANASISTSSVA